MNVFMARVKSSMEEFYQNPEIKEAFENGLFKELVSNDKICICNAANTLYYVFIYFKDSLNNQKAVRFVRL